MDHDQPAGGSSVTAESSETPAFVLDTLIGTQPAAVREDQVQNAVTFLSHPKVRGSTETAKRSFLEKKGLTAEEISEAFKRVPPEALAAAAASASTSSMPSVGANNLVTYTQQPHQAAQAPPQAMLQGPPQALVPAQQMQMMQPQRPPVHWSQVVLGMGVAAAGIYGIHQLLPPRLSAWSQQLFASRKAAADAEAERTAAFTAALEALSQGQTRLQETLESLTAAVKQPQRRADQLGFAESQADYLACQSPSLAKRPQQQQQQYNAGGFGSNGFYGPGPNGPSSVDNYASSSRAAVARGGGWDSYGPYSTYRAASEGRPGSATPPNGHTPAGAGPSGFYGSSATGFEVTPPPMGSYRAPQPPAQYAGSSSNVPAGDPGHARRAGAYARPEETPAATGTSSSARPEEAPRSAAFHEVMAMVQAGITPPNVRTDIDDNPPDPNRPLSAPQMPPRSKPWESGTVSSNVYGTPGAAYSSNMVADGPSGFGVRGYGGAAAGAATPTSAAHAGSSSGPAAAAYTVDEDPSSSSRVDAPVHKSAVGYDLSQLLGADSARDAPWRPPPPPAATVQRPTSSGSTTDKQPLAAAASAPPAQAPTAAAAAGAPAPMQEADVQAAALPTAASAPAAAAADAGDPLSASVAEIPDAAAAAPQDAAQP